MKQESKVCNKCKEEKPLDKFYINKNGSYKGHCKACHIDTVLNIRKTNKRKCDIEGCGRPHSALGYCRMHHARFKYYNADNLEKIFVGETNNPRNLRKYGITEEEFLIMSANGCQICGTKDAPRFAIDHDHACCNEVPYCGECTRGYVCQSCNINISKYEQGKMRDNNPVKKGVVRFLVNHEMSRKRLENIKTWHDIIVDPENKRKEW